VRTPVPIRVISALPAAALLLLAGCVAQTLPGMAGDPQAPPTEAGDVPLAGSGEGVVVEYFVRCPACSAVWSTPEGTRTEPLVEGSLNRRVRYRETPEEPWSHSS
jgi:hypothetical protein